MEAEAVTISRKRKPNHVKSNKNRKKMKSYGGATLKPKKPSLKMIKLFQRRAKAYNSDEDEMGEDDLGLKQEDSSEEEDPRGLDDSKGDGGSETEEDGEDSGHRQGITKFTEGCRAFKMAFMNIMKKNLTNDPLGPVLSAHKKLVAEKLAEEEAEQKAKGEVKKEKHMIAEKGHIKPLGVLDAKEKLLISVATKGAFAKQRKETFLSELKKSTTSSTFNSSQVSHFNKTNEEELGWAPLRDGYMLTSSKILHLLVDVQTCRLMKALLMRTRKKCFYLCNEEIVFNYESKQGEIYV
ncbi:hypothetical protein IEQ34_023123 [Dendrobium chrysotoxum]|uniref:RRP15-like protein n=1 Tax=Dendrobium chrysotoxum TaxID=161865 RepID=A0AAV7G0U2_DENCH|nr:hypothetical protein IEQ34_023123 [Dendrobium chrysotoxum]